MPRRESPKQKPARKPRLDNTLYRHADALKKVVSSDAFPDAIRAISFVMCELTWLTSISIDHPDIIRTAYLEGVRAMRGERDRERFAEIGDVLDDLATLAHYPQDLARVRAIGRRYDDNAFTDEAEKAGTPAPGVTDLNLWRQSHPRPVTRPIFAEKEGRDDA
jgi:hypothetical protein